MERGASCLRRRGRPDCGAAGEDDAVSAPASIDEFLARYPVDERAQDYLTSSPPMVVGRVLREFHPPRQGESDYSGLLTTYVKRLRQTHIAGNTAAGPSRGKAFNGHHAPDHESLYFGKAPLSTGPLWMDAEFQEFCKRYPIDEGAQSYLGSAPAEVMLRIIHEFRPPHEGESDYSALLTTFTKKCRAEARDAGWQQGCRGSWDCNNVQACQAASQPARSVAAAAIDVFAKRYPIDERARDYFLRSAPEVREKVLREFQAKSEGEPDYSGLFTAFVKRCRAACPMQHEQHRWPAQESQRWPGQEPRRWVAQEPSAMHPLGPRGAAGKGRGGGGGGRVAAVAAAAAQHRPQSSASSLREAEPPLREDPLGLFCAEEAARDEQEEDLGQFIARYPMDKRALDYLTTASPSVIDRVMKGFRPKQEGDSDYSALVTTFTKKCKEQEQWAAPCPYDPASKRLRT